MRLRFAVPGDATALAEIYAPHVAHEATSFEAVPPDAAEFARRIDDLTRHYPFLVAEDSGQVIGYSYASPHRPRAGYRWCVEVSVYVRGDRHRGRVGRALYAALFDMLAHQGFVNAYAGVTEPNPASTGFHLAMGFTRVGTYHGIGHKFGVWHDVTWYQRRLADPRPDPPEPVPLPVLRDRGELDRYLGSGEFWVLPRRGG